MNKLFESIPTQVIELMQELNLKIEGEHVNHEINDLLQNTVLLGGKRLRPMLTFLMGHFFQISKTHALNISASSIEMVHAASLSHDDVVDQATLRRGEPSINAASSNKHAVLAGDYLLAHVIVELTKLGRLELVSEMSQVIQALAEGEWVQLNAAKNRDYSEGIIEKIAICKTASVMQWCCVAPAILKDLSPTHINYCRSFGENLGIAFQLMDDTLDFSGHSQKDHLLDLKNGMINSVVFQWLELNPQIKEQFQNGEDILDLMEGQKLDDAINHVRSKAIGMLDRCGEILSILKEELYQENISREQTEAIVALNEILEFLKNRQY